MIERSSIRKFITRLFFGVILLLIWGTRGYAQTVLDFTNDPTNCKSANIGFQATINGSPLNLTDYIFKWDFGGGEKRTGATTSFLFPVEPGAVETSFTVNLVAINNNDGTKYEITKIIKVSPAPIPVLNDANNLGDPFNNCVNSPTPQKPTYTISIKNNSRNKAFIANYLIEWGDGTTRTLAKNQFSDTLNHTYTKLGLFKLKLTTTGDNGCSATKVYDIRNQSNPGIGLISLGSTEGCAPVSFKFKLGGIKDNDPATSYLFDFGDGGLTTWTQADALANDSIISHTYTKSSCNKPGLAYTAKVTASNSCKSTSATVDGITVTSDPAPNFFTSNLCEGKPVLFVNDTHFDCFNKVSYVWNFGDGTANEYSADNSAISHTFPIDKNQYTVSLTARGSCHDTTIFKLVTLVRKPIADFLLPSGKNCLSSQKPILIKATDNSTSYGQPLAYHWSVIPKTGWQYYQSDSTSVSPQFSFSKKGNYMIFLTVSNSCSSDDTFKPIMINDSVYATLPPISSPCDSYTFDASQTASFKIDSISNEKIRAQWIITPATGWAYISPFTATSIAPKISFSTPGAYTITVKLTNDCGTVTKTTSLFIKTSIHNVTTASDTVGCTPKTIDFKDFSTGTNPNHFWTVTPSTYRFITGNAYSKDVSIQFTDAGIYTVTQRVTGDCNTESKSFKITISSIPQITFQPVGNKCEGDIPFKLNIDDTNFKLNNNGVPLTSVKWSVSPTTGVTFEDATTENSTYPHIQFTKTGQYTVSVEVKNTCGTTPASRTFSILTTAVEKAKPSAIIGCAPLPVVFTDQSAGDSLSHNWSVSPAGNWTMNKPANSQSPTITFKKAGIYTVTHTISNQCGSSQNTYSVKVKEKPLVTFSPLPTTCDSYTFYADQHFNVIPNQNDTISYIWTVTPANPLVNFTNSSNQNSQYPTIQISDTGVFVIKASISSTCGDTIVQQTVHITTSPKIALNQTLNTNCLPSDLTFTGTVYGQNLIYQWSVLPNYGNSFQNSTNSSSPRPHILFTQPGYYEVTLKVSNNCGTDIHKWKDTIIGKPTILFSQIPDTCDNYKLKTEKFVTFQENGSAITGYNWTITPNTGYEYKDGTTSTSEFPHILFKDAATYQLTAEATNACGVSLTSKRSFTIDKFIQVTVGPDSTFCANPDLIKLTGYPSGGSWSIIPASASTRLSINGSITYYDPSVPGVYTLTYHRGNTYCFSEASRKFNVIALPVVDAGRDFSLCSNDSNPYTLTGTPAGGTWSGTGVTGSSFSNNGLTVGSYILKYSYTDPVTSCMNTDQLVARVLDVPLTGFNAPQGCKDKPLTFTPFGLSNTKYTWDFGDGQTGSSTGPINHTYHLGGVYTVSLASSDPNNCALSSSKTIKIQEEKAKPSDTIGCAPLVVGFTDQSTGDLLSHNWSVSPAGTNTYSPSSTAQSPTLTFSKAGIYTVTHTTSTACGSDQHNYMIRVRDTATAIIKPFSNACDSYTFTADPQNFIVTPNQNDTISYLWSVTPFTASVNFINNTSKTSKYPSIHIADTGVFVIKVQLTGICGTTETHQTIRITQKPEIALKQSINKRCIPSDLTFSGTVYGQNLVYQWSVLPNTGIVFQNYTNASSPRPQIRFTQSGIYVVSLNVTNNCSTVSKQWSDTIAMEPSIVFNPIPDTCDNYTFKSEHFIKVLENGSPVTSYNWSIVPNNGFKFTDGTQNNVEYPHIQFTDAGTYTITFKATNECGVTTASRLFTADKFIQVKVGSDSTFCTNPNPIPLYGNPVGGSWSILPTTASSLLKVNGGVTYFDPSVPGIYTLTYHRGNNYCFSEATKKYTVVALPIVDAGRDFNICSNETKPYSLNATPTGGTWTGSGLTGNTFSAVGLAVGSYILKYNYTDPKTTCINSDQLVARVLDVPVTGFTAPVQGCKDQPVTFTPFGTANTVFNWDFGDGQTGSSTGPITHKYLKGGLFTVNLISSDPNNCAYATNRKITIQGDIVMPVVNYKPTNGCGPVTVTFTIDTTGSTGNGQKHLWDFGNGTVVKDAITGKVTTYNPGLADTTYTVHLTVSNDCFNKTADYNIVVRSKPNSNFTFPQPWVCSPSSVRLKNQTIDRRATFYWDFDDGTTSTEFEPTHLFTVAKIARNFKVKLVASNGCGKDSVTKSILVKPNSLDAYIQMSVLQACPGDTVTFKNLSTDTVQLISSYYWDFGDGNIANTWDATHAYANPGNYTVKLFISNGCSKAETTAHIEILKIPDLQIASLDTICKRDSLKLQGSSNGVVLINGKWDFGDGSFASGTNVVHAYQTIGWHTITFRAADVTSILKCAGLVTKRVYVKDTPPPISLPDLAGCSPFSISIPSPGPDSYLWNFGDDKLWNASSKHTYINNGSQPFRKKVTILSENNLLCRTTSFFWVTIYPTPIAKIGVRSEGGYPEVVYFRNLSANTATCEWLMPDGTIGYSCDSILFRYFRNGPSTINLKTTNQYGCIDTISIVHQTLIKGLFVPNALQPSNSDPLVKIFKPIGIGLKKYHLGIYDIWDNLIWETEKLKDTETEEGWDGKAITGKELPQGVYIWRISAIYIDGSQWKGVKRPDKTVRTEGTLTLIR